MNEKFDKIIQDLISDNYENGFGTKFYQATAGLRLDHLVARAEETLGPEVGYKVAKATIIGIAPMLSRMGEYEDDEEYFSEYDDDLSIDFIPYNTKTVTRRIIDFFWRKK